ncbi:MAG: peptide deformylase [Bacteroidota bacterium]|nr:peptide deformylase [Bacteroidota bacterium]
MAILPIYTYDARVLREETRAIQKPDSRLVKLVVDMFETMRAANGIGLAANQVGQGLSLFVVDLSETDEKETRPLVFINPVLLDAGKNEIPLEEGCLSVPGVREEILRPERIVVRYRDMDFNENELVADGLLARVVQHEYDHLRGVFFTDYLRGLKKRLIFPVLRNIKEGQTKTEYRIVPVKKQAVLP